MRVSEMTRRWVGVVAALLLGVFALACGGGDGDDVGSTGGESGEIEHVQIAYVVESSWFATDPDMVRASLTTAANHMTTCADSPERSCQVMMFAVQGAEVSAKRVPASLQQNSETGYWYPLDPTVEVDSSSQRRRLVSQRIDAFMSEVSEEIVPATYDAQPKGCVNLVGNISTAFDELSRHPGGRNIVVVLASGISNCLNQPFYPDRPFPTEEDGVAGILADIPAGSARIESADGTVRPVCFDWSPMFGEAVLEANVYVGQEERQVLKAIWVETMHQWGALQGNSPGEQIGDCLTMEISAS